MRFINYLSEGIIPKGIQKGDNNSIYEVYYSSVYDKAIQFLKSVPTIDIPPFYYIIIETPVENLGKDIDGIYIKGQNDVIQEISIKTYEKIKLEKKLQEFQNESEHLKKSKPIDSFLLTLIEKYKISCIILNGTSANLRVLEYFDDSKSVKKVFTMLKCD